MASGFQGRFAQKILSTASQTLGKDFNRTIDDSLSGSYIVAVDDDVYEQANRIMLQTDQQLAEKADYVISQIKDLCETDFIAPSINPKIIEMVESLHTTLADFVSITAQINNATSRYVNEISDIDSTV